MKKINRKLLALGNVKKERSLWRDRDLSVRHRSWGRELYATDLDFVEAGLNAKPLAIIEAKYTDRWCWNDYSIRIQRNLADKAKLPFFVIRRFDNYDFDVHPGNSFAREYVKTAVRMTEKQFIELQYRLRFDEDCELTTDGYRAVIENAEAQQLDGRAETF